jgi:hypothetical protein
MNTAQPLIAKFGGQTRLAKLLRLRQSTVEYWAISGSIPARWQQQIVDVGSEHSVSVSPAEFAVVTAKGEVR